MADTPPMCVRAPEKLRKAIDEAARLRGWTRTTWILYWIGKGLDHDRRIFGLTEDEQANDVRFRAAEVERNRRWRKTRRNVRP